MFMVLDAEKHRLDLLKSSYLMLALNEDAGSTDLPASFRTNILWAIKCHQQVAHDKCYVIE